jgi:hypothetical protein
MIGRRKLQAGDPPPDLAIETDVTSPIAIEAYKAITVPEVWIHADGVLQIYLLQANGDYCQSPRSSIFPNLPIADWVEQAIAQAWTVGSLQAIEAIEANLRALDQG